MNNHTTSKDAENSNLGWLRKVWRQFKKTDTYGILVDVIAGGVPFGLTLGGLLLIVIGSIPEKPDIFMRSVAGAGSAILAGGVFSVILKTMQVRGVFQDTLSKVLFDEPYLKKRNDLRELWSKVTSLISKQRFSTLESHMHEAIMEHYIPTKDDYYFENYYRTCVVRWNNEETTEISLSEEISLHIVPTSADAEITYKFSSSPSPGVPLEVACPKVDYLKINNKVYFENGKPLKEEYIQEGKGKEGEEFKVAIPLAGSKRYVVERRSHRTFPMGVDPFQRYVSPRFIKGAKINVHCIAKNLRVRFVSLGTPNEFSSFFPKEIADISRAGDINREYPGLLFPEQGYLLVFHYLDPKLVKRFDVQTNTASEEGAAASAKN